MRLLAPSGLWLLLAVPVIVAFYLLKVRRESRRVPSTFLWDKTLAELRADTPFQKLKASLPLWLQLAAAALLALAAARPVLHAGQRAGATVVLVLDGSASMKAGKRLERGRGLLAARLAAAEAGDRAALIVARREPEIASPLTADLSAVQQALARATPTDEEADLEKALRLAFAVASRTASAEVVVATDDPAGAARVAAGNKKRRVVVQSLEEPAENAGIVTLESRLSGARTELYAAVQNFGRKPRTVRLELDLDGALVETRTLDLAPGRREGVSADLPPSARGVVTARIDGKDALAADDRAWLVLRAERRIKVLLVSPGNVFLEKAWALDKRVRLEAVKPGGYSRTLADGYDLVAFDRWTPPSPPQANVLLLGAGAPELGVELSPGATEPLRLTERDERHPLASHADLRGVTVSKPLEARLEPWARPLASADGRPLVFAGEREGRRFVGTAFSVLDSDWPLRVSFPIFLANATVWLGQPRGELGAGTLRPGEPLVLDKRLLKPGKPATVTDPDGKTTTLPPGTDIYSATGKVGLYTVRSGDAEDVRAVSLLSEKESRLFDPAGAPAARSLGARAGSSGGAAPDLWRTLAAACLAVLMLELLVVLRRQAPA